MTTEQNNAFNAGVDLELVINWPEKATEFADLRERLGLTHCPVEDQVTADVPADITTAEIQESQPNPVRRFLRAACEIGCSAVDSVTSASKRAKETVESVFEHRSVKIAVCLGGLAAAGAAGYNSVTQFMGMAIEPSPDLYQINGTGTDYSSSEIVNLKGKFPQNALPDIHSIISSGVEPIAHHFENMYLSYGALVLLVTAAFATKLRHDYWRAREAASET